MSIIKCITILFVAEIVANFCENFPTILQAVILSLYPKIEVLAQVSFAPNEVLLTMQFPTHSNMATLISKNNRTRAISTATNSDRNEFATCI